MPDTHSHFNAEADLAFRFIRDTNRHVFLTGKAGSGKTTFLRRVKKEIPKRSVIVAPTGVAAINAQGVTIHSLFQLPFGPLIPGDSMKKSEQRKFARQKINLIRSLDLVIIDEISMVRCDVLDAINEVLQRYRGNKESFGGVQLLMIGDLHQLPPVVKPYDWSILSPYYKTSYFFGCLALQRSTPIIIELQHIYRQTDQDFIGLLNKIRNNTLDEAAIDLLNSRYQEKSNAEDDTIVLTSLVKSAQKINEEKLAALDGESHFFNARVEGQFPENAYPNHKTLEFKEGAQVMFIKNDLSEDQLYYNGKIGRILEIDEGIIRVQCEGDDHVIYVSKATWENTKYNLNEKSKTVEENVLGTFTQYPLRLAWAITIHKSQGLTFDKVVIDAANAFAHGQVYVALSRCRSFEGITLYSKIQKESILTDKTIESYESDAAANAPDETHLLQAQREFQQYILRQLFDFSGLKYNLDRLYKYIAENETILHGDSLKKIETLQSEHEEKVWMIAQRFLPSLNNYFNNSVLPAENTSLAERLRSAEVYFSKELKNNILEKLKQIQPITDNHDVEEGIENRQTEVLQNLHSKIACFQTIQKEFNPQAYITARANADIDQVSISRYKVEKAFDPENIENAELYNQLSNWRRERAYESDKPAYTVASTKTLIEICKVLPTEQASMLLIHGIGKKRYDAIGEEIIEMVKDYCSDHDLEGDLLEKASKKPKKKKVVKKKSSEITFEMYREGMSIDEIAEERSFVRSTIESHLARAISDGRLSIFDFIEKDMVEKAVSYFENTHEQDLALAKTALENKLGFGELKMVLAHIESNKVASD